jgi:8-oxo-dGTP pyrophosphatase MutT (NUDIX family)
MAETAVQIASQLASRVPCELAGRHSGRAAVLMPIWQQEDALYFLLTQRTETVETHKGQISFPGGMRDSEEEPLVQTALRETREEIGLPESQIRILGQFDDYLSSTDLIVTPFAGWVSPPLELSPNPEEVEEILEVPWSLFRDPGSCRTETLWRLDRDILVYHYDFHGRDVWGLTARIIRDFLHLIDQSPP